MHRPSCFEVQSAYRSGPRNPPGAASHISICEDFQVVSAEWQPIRIPESCPQKEPCCRQHSPEVRYPFGEKSSVLPAHLKSYAAAHTIFVSFLQHLHESVCNLCDNALQRTLRAGTLLRHSSLCKSSRFCKDCPWPQSTSPLFLIPNRDACAISRVSLFRES